MSLVIAIMHESKRFSVLFLGWQGYISGKIHWAGIDSGERYVAQGLQVAILLGYMGLNDKFHLGRIVV